MRYIVHFVLRTKLVQMVPAYSSRITALCSLNLVPRIPVGCLQDPST